MPSVLCGDSAMKNKLDVYLNQIKTGQLSKDIQGDMIFTYHPSYADNEKNLPLSQSLLLRKMPYHVKQCLSHLSAGY